MLVVLKAAEKDDMMDIRRVCMMADEMALIWVD